MLRSTASSKPAEELSKPHHQQQQHLYEIKEDDKFFTKLVSKENSVSNPSFRGVSVAVPFTWETQPGTPKHNFSPHPTPTTTNHHNSLTTLSPPPSYYFTPNHEIPTSSAKHYYFKSKLLLNIWNTLHLKKTHNDIPLSPSSPFSFSTSSSSSMSSRSGNPPPSSSKFGRGRRRLLSIGSSSVFDDDFQVCDVLPSSRSFPKSILCFKA